MCQKAVEKDSWCFRFAPNQHITRGMSKRAVLEEPYMLEYYPHRCKMCDKVVKKSSRAL